MAKEIEIIKKGYSKDRFNLSQIDELRRCMKDPIYFCKNYIKIQHPIKGRVPFDMYPYQEDMIRLFHENKYSICLTGRQQGKTTTAGSFLLWKAMFHPDTTILIAANKYNQALEIMDRIRFSYENLEQYNWLRSGVLEYNKGTISFDNGSKIISRATSPDAGRGLSISLLYCDEFAFVHPNKAVEFWSAMSPTLATGGNCIITSTPASDEDQFAQVWFGSQNTIDDQGNENPDGVGSNGFKGIKVTWDKVPGRDEAWAATQKAQLGEEKFQREFNCEFMGAGDDSLINPLTISGISSVDPVFKIGEVRWFSDPIPNHIHGVALDPSTGTEKGDYSAIQVFDLNTLTQVAEWRNNKATIPNQINTLRDVLRYIHHVQISNPEQEVDPEIYWSLENNGCGEAALNEVDHVGEENFPGVFVHEPRKSGGGRGRKGLNTNVRTKMTACMKFKTLLESRRLIIKSRPLLSEIKSFVRSGGSYAAKLGSSDDLVMSTLQVVRLLQICASWDEVLENNYSRRDDYGDDDDMGAAPMPILV